MKKLALLAVFASASHAFASFDLALVLQNYDSPNGPTQTVITRWDPVNRMELGRFEAPGIIASSKLMLDPSAPGVLTGATISGGVFRLNSYAYSSGNYLGQSILPIVATSLSSADMLSNGTMLLTGANGASPFARLFTSTGATLRSYSLPAGTLGVVDAQIGEDGVVHVLSRQAGTTSDDKFTLTSHAANSASIAQSVVIADNTTASFTNIVRQGNVLAFGLSQLSARRVVTVNGTSIGTPTNTGGWFIPTSKLVAGHGNMIHGIGYESTETRTYVSSALIDSSLGGNYFYSSNPAYGTVYDAVIVVAPEPGTMIALGAGLAAILRRRRNRK